MKNIALRTWCNPNVRILKFFLSELPVLFRFYSGLSLATNFFENIDIWKQQAILQF